VARLESNEAPASKRSDIAALLNATSSTAAWPPRRTTLKFKGYHQVPVVPPVKSMEVTFSSITQKKAPKRADVHQFKLVILEFDDASNLPWRRGIDGALIALRARDVISPERHLEWTY